MDTPLLIDLAQVLGGFLGGIIAGVLSTMWITARVRLMESITVEAEKTTSSKRQWFTADRAATVMILGMMLALLLAGVSMILNSNSIAEDARRDCVRAVETSKVLAERTRNYVSGARADLRWKREVRDELLKMGTDPKSPLIQSTRTAVTAAEDYLEHLEDNPYPRRSAEDC